jgi:hopanoid biosynthesis associated RND transporter like protein HpnN
MRDTLLDQLARFIWRRAALVWTVAAVLAVAGGVYAWNSMRLNADTNDLIARDRPFMADFRAMMDEFGDTEYINVVVALPEDGDIARTEAAVDELTLRLRALEELPGVFSSVEPREQLRIATRAMSEQELEGFSSAAAGLDAVQTGDASIVLATADELLKQLIDGGAKMDPVEQKRLAAAGIFALKAVASARQGSASESELAALLGSGLKRQYFTSDTGRLYFIDIMPMKDYGSLSVIDKPLRRIAGVIDDVRREFPGIEIGLMGKPVLQADEMSTTSDDMTKASLIAIALCWVLYLLMIGGIRRPLLLVLAFAMGAAWTYGAATLIVGQLNLLSIVFMLVLIGVGMDYGVHVIARYQEHRRMGEPALTATRAAFQTAVRGNITGALTSSSVFFMALLTTFQGLRELGLIAGGGILLCLVAMIVVLPALLATFDGRRPDRRTRTIINFDETNAHGILHFMVTWPATVLAIAALATAALAVGIRGLHFEQNLLNLQARGLESVEWEHRVFEDSASNTWFGSIITDDIQEVPEIVDRAAQRTSIGKVRSVLDVIRLPTEQREAMRMQLRERRDVNGAVSSEAWKLGDLQSPISRLSLIARGAEREAPEEAAGLHALVDDLRTLARELETDSRKGDVNRPGGARDRIDRHIQTIAGSLRTMLEGDQMTLHEAMPDGLRQRFVSPGGKLLVMLHPREDVWEFEPMRQFISDLRGVDPNVTGVPITHFESLVEMRQAFVRMAWLALICVALLVWLDFRSFKDLVLAMIPLSVGMLWTFGLMGLFHISFNLANFFSVPIILGLGIAGSLQILHRYHEGGESRLHLGATRKAVVLTSLTTIIGFGALMIAQHRGLRSLGLAMFIGISSCMAASLIILPATLAFMEHRGWKQPKGRAGFEQRHEPRVVAKKRRRRAARMHATAHRIKEAPP